MKVLVTGATGFIGRHVLDRLLKHGHECIAIARHEGDLPKGVSFLQGDIADRATVTGKLDKVEGVVHLAAREDILMERGDRFGDRMFESNVIGTQNLLESLKRKQIQRVVVITSCTVNGYFSDGRLAKETNRFNMTRLESPYIWSRYQTEKLCLEFAAESWPLVLVEPTFVIGPGDARPNFPGKMILEFLQGKVKVVPQGGSNWISVRDVSRGIVHLLETTPKHVRYLFGDQNMTFREFYNLVAQAAGLDVPKLHLPRELAKATGSLADWLLGVYGQRPGVPLKNMAKISGEFFYFDCSRANEEGCYDGGNVTIAIKEAVEWFRSQGRI